MAISLNGMIGSGIFALPATAARLLGPMSPAAYLTAGAAVLLIALCFAEAGSRFDHSGGPYLYARSAFGAFIGFEMGWMFILSRLTSVAAITNTFCAYLGYFWPAASQGTVRTLLITVVIGALAVLHCRGVRPGVAVLNFLTVGKLVPLVLFCLVGLFFVDTKVFAIAPLDPGSLAKTSLLSAVRFRGLRIRFRPKRGSDRRQARFADCPDCFRFHGCGVISGDTDCRRRFASGFGGKYGPTGASGVARLWSCGRRFPHDGRRFLYSWHGQCRYSRRFSHGACVGRRRAAAIAVGDRSTLCTERLCGR